MRAEAPGPVPDRLTPRITSTAKLLWIVYGLLSLSETMLLMVGGMSLYEALCHTFGTMATGGFSTRDASIAAFNSMYIEGVIILFMFLAGASFSLHFRFIFDQNWRGFWKDEEFRFYLMVIFGGTALVTWNLFQRYHHDVFQSFRQAFFQVVSITTTTGFCTTDFDLWPSFSKMILLVLMFVGGCAGSTGGAMKHVRVLILCKHGLRELRRLILPGAVLPIRVSRKPVSDEVVTNVLGFFLLYMLVFVIATFVVSFLGVSFITAFASVAATLGNIGPGYEAVGAVRNYAGLPQVVKVILSFCMLAGRLEIYTVLILLMPSFWKK
jgi:trk system potassium uptake protein TrkH